MMCHHQLMLLSYLIQCFFTINNIYSFRQQDAHSVFRAIPWSRISFHLKKKKSEWVAQSEVHRLHKLEVLASDWRLVPGCTRPLRWSLEKSSGKKFGLDSISTLLSRRRHLSRSQFREKKSTSRKYVNHMLKCSTQARTKSQSVCNRDRAL